MKSARRRARELALQGVYEWLISRSDVEQILTDSQEVRGIHKTDQPLFEALLRGVIDARDSLDSILTPHLDRSVAELSPIEHAILLLGAFELVHRIDIPYRVAINEAVELAKTFGGTDGHRYVNGVLDKVADSVREVEIAASKASRGAAGLG